MLLTDSDTATETEIDLIKKELRGIARAQRAALGSSVRALHAKAAAAFFANEIDLPKDAIVAAYWPIRDEIDSKPLLIHLMDHLRQTVALPVVMGDELPLMFRQWESDAPLFEAGFGALAPSETAPVVVPDMIIIPLLAYDEHGTRLGYGRGYYDRTIAAMVKKPTIVGYAFSAQELSDIPREDHDYPLDYLITETGVRRFVS